MSIETPEAAVSATSPEAGVCVLRLERPQALNAMRVPSMLHFHQVLDQVLADRGLRAIVLTGAGKGFCAGLDLKSVLDEHGEFALSVERATALQHTFASVMQRLHTCDAAVIAAVNGVAVGAGMALALAADIRFAAPEASFHVGAVRVGLTAGECGISYHLPRLVGAGRAFELMLTGRPVPADVVPGAELMDRAMRCARDVIANAPYATAHTKRLMWQNVDAGSFDAAIELENHAQVLGLMTADFREAARAFAQKRKPRFGQGS